MGLTRMLGAVLCCAFFQPAHAVETIETGMPGAANAIMWPWYIGISNGFFAAAGIALDVIYVPTPTGLMQQLTAGSLDIVADIGVVEPIHAVSKGAPVALLRITGAVPPYEMVAQPAIKSLRDLRGKTVVIGGLHTHLCIRHTAADAFFRGYRIVIVKDGVEVLTNEDQKHGLQYLESVYGARILTVDDIIWELVR